MRKETNEKLYERMESYHGRELTAKEKKNARKTYKALERADRQMTRKQSATNYSARRNSFFKYALTAFISIILCLSVVLPIKFINTNTQPSPTITRYTEVFTFRIDHSFLDERGYLLFIYDYQIFDGEYRVEFPKQNPNFAISYTIHDSTVYIDSLTFEMDFRIRTFRYYSFERYYEHFFATLEHKHDRTQSIPSGQIIYFENITIVESPDDYNANREPITIHAFILNNIPVFFHFDGWHSVGYIYFVYDGNEYFITLRDENGYGMDKYFIKNDFVYTLFGNMA